MSARTRKISLWPALKAMVTGQEPRSPEDIDDPDEKNPDVANFNGALDQAQNIDTTKTVGEIYKTNQRRGRKEIKKPDINRNKTIQEYADR